MLGVCGLTALHHSLGGLDGIDGLATWTPELSSPSSPLHDLLGHLDLKLPEGVSSWRIEEVFISAWTAFWTLVASVTIVESPRFLLQGKGDVSRGLSSARQIAEWNGLGAELEESLALDPQLEPLALDPQLESLAVHRVCLEDLTVAHSSRPHGNTHHTSPTQSRSYAFHASRETHSSETTILEDAAVTDNTLLSRFTLSPEGRNGTKKLEVLHLTAVLALLQFAWNLDYYTLTFSAGDLSDALLLNLCLLAAVDLPGSAASSRSCDGMGAQRTAALFVGASGCCLLALAALQSGSLTTALGDDHAAYFTALSLLGKTTSTGVFAAVFLLTAERFPVQLRAAALGLGTMFGKLGASVAPSLTAMLPLPLALGLIGATSLGASVATATLPAGRTAAAVNALDTANHKGNKNSDMHSRM